MSFQASGTVDICGNSRTSSFMHLSQMRVKLSENILRWLSRKYRRCCEKLTVAIATTFETDTTSTNIKTVRWSEVHVISRWLGVNVEAWLLIKRAVWLQLTSLVLQAQHTHWKGFRRSLMFKWSCYISKTIPRVNHFTANCLNVVVAAPQPLVNFAAKRVELS